MKMAWAVLAIVMAGAPGLTLGAQAKDKKLVTTATDALSWGDLSPQRPGVKVADVAGDHTKGAWKGLVKYPGVTKSGLHKHSADLEIVVVSGTFNFGETPDAEKPYGPGSYIRVPAGVPHSNSTAEECTIFITQPGKYDTKAIAPGGEGPKK